MTATTIPREAGDQPRPEPTEPWAKENLAKQPKDQWGYPLAQVAFLHNMLNIGDHVASATSGRLSAYNVNFELILDNFAPEMKEQAKKRLPELRALVSEQIQAARTLEIEHWRLRDLDYHRAVENGDYLVVEHVEGDEDAACTKRNGDALAALGLGQMNRDYFYITCNARSASANGRASGLVYLTRAKYPKSFELLEELSRISSDAQRVIREKMGVFEPPKRPIFPM